MLRDNLFFSWGEGGGGRKEGRRGAGWRCLEIKTLDALVDVDDYGTGVEKKKKKKVGIEVAGSRAFDWRWCNMAFLFFFFGFQLGVFSAVFVKTFKSDVVSYNK